jgi:UDP-glucose 4-epimerase
MFSRHRTQRILVTGGFGFIGSHLIDLLLKEKKEVHVIDNLSSNPLPMDYLLKELGHPFNLSYDICDVSEFFNKEAYQFDLIYHLASVVGPAGILPHTGRIIKQIVDNTYHIVDLALKTKTKLVYVSSSEVYGGGDNGLCSEQMDKVIPAKISARTEYAIGKLASEIVITNISQVNELRANIVRPFNVCGPRQSGRGGFVLPRFIGLAMENAPLTVFGNGKQIRAFTHVAEIAEGIIKVGKLGKSSQIYNLGNPKNKISILDLAKIVIKVVGSNSDILFVNPKNIYGPLYEEAKDKYPQSGLAINELGWKAKKDVYTIVEETYTYMRALQKNDPEVFYALLGFTKE